MYKIMDYLSTLPPDILRQTILNLPVDEIFDLCEGNDKNFQQYICNYRQFWEALFLREIDEEIKIPPNAPIDWYKEKIKIWSSVKVLVELIREDKVAYTKYIQPFNENWNSFEIIENLKKLSCYYNKLTSLPPMPNLKSLGCENNRLTFLFSYPNLEFLSCESNQLTFLPLYPKLKQLLCNNNQLTFLPSMPYLEILSCHHNKLISLPSMSNLLILNCQNNQLTTLPPFPKLKILHCDNNPLPFFTLEEWRKEWEGENQSSCLIA